MPRKSTFTYDITPKYTPLPPGREMQYRAAFKMLARLVAAKLDERRAAESQDEPTEAEPMAAESLTHANSIQPKTKSVTF